MTETVAESAEHRLHEAVVRWDAGRSANRDLILAACQALVDGLDSPALRDLAGAAEHDRSSDLGDLATRSLDELGIPRPGGLPVGYAVAPGGGLAPRSTVDELRLEVSARPEAHDPFQVLVYVNDVEMTAAGAGLGMDPYDLLVPTNRLVATAEPHTVPIARCECGVYGCGATDVTIVRVGDLVHWTWSLEMPTERGVSFAADRYDAEVARVAADHSWETPERTAGRLVLADLDRERLGRHGLRPGWAGNHHRNRQDFLVTFTIDGDYQVFVHFRWRGRGPRELAREVRETLAGPPADWPATWHPMAPDRHDPPTVAGPRWQRDRLR